MKAINVSRVSTEEQKEAGNSLPAQIEHMEKYCKSKSFEIIKSFSFDESAYKDKRDEFDKLVEFVQEVAKKEKVAVIFDKVDRLSRSIFDKRVGMLYELALTDKIELHFVSDGQTINNQMSAVEKFQFGMSLGLAKYYSDAIGDNVRRAFEQKRRVGELTGPAPIGYVNVPLDAEKRLRKDIIVDPDKGPLVVSLFEMYASGNYSITTAWDKVTSMGLVSKDGKKLSRSNIEHIIKNPFYYGQAYSRKYGLYPTLHPYPRLISKDLFDKCQDVLSGRSKNRSKMVSDDFIFKGLLTCPKCKCLYSPEIHKGNVYYSCTNARRICKREYVNEKVLLEPIYELLERFSTITEDVQNKLVKELRKSTEFEVTYHKEQFNRINTEYDRIKQKDDALLDAYIEKSITKDIYDKKHVELQDKLQKLDLERIEHTKGDFDYQTTVAMVISVARRAKEIFKGSEPAQKRVFLNMLLQNPTVNGKKLEFTMRSPFNLVLELASSPNWLRG